MPSLPARMAAGSALHPPLAGEASYADGGRALPCTRDFFVKKSSKNFISAAAGMGASQTVYERCPARQNDGGMGGFMQCKTPCEVVTERAAQREMNCTTTLDAE